MLSFGDTIIMLVQKASFEKFGRLRLLNLGKRLPANMANMEKKLAGGHMGRTSYGH